MTGISPSTVLPALREDITFHTSDGLTLVGELARPVDGPGDATLVTLHPLPTEGGFMIHMCCARHRFDFPRLPTSMSCGLTREGRAARAAVVRVPLTRPEAKKTMWRRLFNGQ